MKGIIFDADGTLLDSMGFWMELGENYLKAKGICPERELGKKLFAMTTSEGVAYLKERYPLKESVSDIMKEVERMTVRYYAEEVKLKPGVKQFLEELSRRQIPVTIATSAERKLVERALERLQVRNYFQRIFTCTEVGKGKGEPDIFLEAARFMNTDRKDTWVAEDGLYAAQTARRAGFRVAGVYDKSSREDEEAMREVSDIYLYTLEEFPWENMEERDRI